MLSQLIATLDRLGTPERAIFATADLRSALPDLSTAQFKVHLSRAVQRGVLQRVCRGIYCYPHAQPNQQLVLYHAAARLRAGHLCYLSLESVLSHHGVISQIPLDRLTLMTSGRRATIACGPWGSIEFTHTKRRAHDLAGQLTYDAPKRLWVATPQLAWRDLKRVGRNNDFVDLNILAEISERYTSSATKTA